MISEVIKPLTEKEKRERQEQRTQWRRFVLPEFKLPLRKNKEVDEIEELIDGRPKPFQVRIGSMINNRMIKLLTKIAIN